MKNKHHTYPRVCVTLSTYGNIHSIVWMGTYSN